jgi:hypothetical protein
VRDHFARRTAPPSEDEERAFIDAKLEMIRGDPRLSRAEKATAIADLENKLRREQEGPPPS